MRLAQRVTASHCQAIAFFGRGPVELAGCKTLETSTFETSSSCLSILQFATGPKRSMGHVLGAEKGIFFIRGAEADEATGRPRRLNPVNPCQRGVPGVA